MSRVGHLLAVDFDDDEAETADADEAEPELPFLQNRMRRHRWLQRLAARGFAQAESEACVLPFDDGDVRREAAFRCWLRALKVDADPPPNLPVERELEFLATCWDCEYGAYAWWAWPIWSSCSACCQGERIDCAECQRLFAFSDYAFRCVRAPAPSEASGGEEESDGACSARSSQFSARGVAASHPRLF